MRRWFDTTKTYIFVAPIAIVMAGDGGCASSTQEAMDQEQVTAALVGNTVYNDATEAYAFIDPDGTIRAEISFTDNVKTDLGTWTLDDEGTFCVDWTKTLHGKDNCSGIAALDGTSIQWGGHTLLVQEGNPNNL